MVRWSDLEWSFCLSCVYHNANLDDALTAFCKKYPNRNQSQILKRFKSENLNMEQYLGSGLGKTKISKKSLIQKLHQVYKILGQPFDANQFNNISQIRSEVLTGCFGSWENALSEANLLKKFEKQIELTSQIKSFSPESEIKKNWQKEKEKLVSKEELKKVKEVRKLNNKLDLLTGMVTDAVLKIKEPKIIVRQSVLPSTNGKKNCILWFEFSDLQLGTLINDWDMAGLNKYNWSVWQKELEIWKKEVINLIDTYGKIYKIDKIVFSMLGDFVEGVDIFQGQSWQIEKHVVDQAILGAEDVANAFIEIFKTFDNYTFHIFEVFGNHGRLGRKGETPYSNSMDKVFLRFLKLRLDSAVYNFKYYENDCWFYLVRVYGWNHLLLHGDQGMSSLWSRRPTINGLEKGIAKYNQMLQQQINFIHCGHFHQQWQLSFNSSQMLINGSFIGTSQFSASQMVSGSAPIQTMHVFEPQFGLVNTTRIHLYDDDIRVRVKPNETT